MFYADVTKQLQENILPSSSVKYINDFHTEIYEQHLLLKIKKIFLPYLNNVYFYVNILHDHTLWISTIKQNRCAAMPVKKLHLKRFAQTKKLDIK